MKKKVLVVSLCLLFISNIASAKIVQGIDIDFVTIGNAGNPGDTRGGGLANPYGCGAVGYDTNSASMKLPMASGIVLYQLLVRQPVIRVMPIMTAPHGQALTCRQMG